MQQTQYIKKQFHDIFYNHNCVQTRDTIHKRQQQNEQQTNNMIWSFQRIVVVRSTYHNLYRQSVFPSKNLICSSAPLFWRTLFVSFLFISNQIITIEISVIFFQQKTVPVCESIASNLFAIITQVCKSDFSHL